MRISCRFIFEWLLPCQTSSLFVLSFLRSLTLQQADQWTPEKEVQCLSKWQQYGDTISKNTFSRFCELILEGNIHGDNISKNIFFSRFYGLILEDRHMSQQKINILVWKYSQCTKKYSFRHNVQKWKYSVNVSNQI